MLQSAWLTVGLVALVVSIGAVVTEDNAAAIMAGVLGFVLWGVWTFGALNVVVVTSSGTVISYTNPAAAIAGVMMALVPGYIALTGPIDIISRHRDPDVRDI